MLSRHLTRHVNIHTYRPIKCQICAKCRYTYCSFRNISFWVDIYSVTNCYYLNPPVTQLCVLSYISTYASYTPILRTPNLSWYIPTCYRSPYLPICLYFYELIVPCTYLRILPQICLSSYLPICPVIKYLYLSSDLSTPQT